ncbi:MAG TPA: UDP-2,4-diacetamido-2,4,6-trideoxy-beta-L-altropyranose hydrolase [Opitutaceae bacterium]|nr:UDP-2,4-diacetamido-2,4,6-trideoxy-beta-L-altropyranose hydrolase [Opitutaceae bacterium]
MNLVIRADASVAAGTGHVMRCLALAQAWRHPGRQVTFAQAEGLPSLSQRLRREGYEVVAVNAAAGSSADAICTLEIARRREATWIVADGYHFGKCWQHEVHEGSSRLLVINDLPMAGRYLADLVLNQNLHALNLTPEKAPYTRLLFGPTYVLLRDEFARIDSSVRNPPEVARKILVTLGGSDPANATEIVIEALRTLPDVEVTVIAGIGNQRCDLIAQRVRKIRPDWRFLINPADLPSLMSEADLAVTAAGSTCWELARSGTPMALLVVAANQVALAQSLAEAGAAFHLGTHPGLDPASLPTAIGALLRSPQHRRTLAAHASSLVDGLGRLRVISQMRTTELTLRPVSGADIELVWRWANEPGVRRMSFQCDPISWSEHQDWFARKLADPNCHFFLAMAGSQPIGQIRFDIAGAIANVSVSLAPAARGHGWGPSVIRAGCDRLASASPIEEVVASIKKDNFASLRAFRIAGFVPMEPHRSESACDLRLRLPNHP